MVRAAGPAQSEDMHAKSGGLNAIGVSQQFARQKQPGVTETRR